MHALRVNETKLTSANAFIVDVFALGGDRKSQWAEKTILALLFRMTINKLFCVTANIQLCKFKFKEGVKLV